MGSRLAVGGLGGLQHFPGGVGNLLIGAGAKNGISGQLNRDAGFNQGGDHHGDGLLFGAASLGQGQVQGLDDGGVTGGSHLLIGW